MIDTIFALSSGAPPAAIAVMRVSGTAAGPALRHIAGRVPEPRRASMMTLRDGSGDVLDRALVLWLPGPGTATGEDLAELHLHGGRAVVAAVEAALSAQPGLRMAQPGEFTRRAFANGRIDLAEAEGLADLLEAETELQRRAAQAMAGGALSRQVADWREQVLSLSATVEALLDFGDEDDVGSLPRDFDYHRQQLAAEIGEWLARPRAEALRGGFRVVLAGPPNAGKSSLFNALLESDAAITAPTPGTTRDVIERPVVIAGIPFVLVDTAGLRESTDDAIEQVGMDRARAELEGADLVLWLGPEGEGPPLCWEVSAKCDLAALRKNRARVCVSAKTGEGLDALKRSLVDAARLAMPTPGQAVLNRRQFDLLAQASTALLNADLNDLLIIAENLRLARLAFERLIGSASTEHMLDALFARFCIGK
jgi:tRNA modification GTPase